MRRYPAELNEDEIPLYAAQEMARVGIVPWRTRLPIGTTKVIAGQVFAVIGYATREEFLQAVKLADLKQPEAFDQCPPDMHFLRITTD